MISRLGHAMPRLLAGANFAGEGMRERLRTATFALFGLVTAVGLVLVGIAYNQGWPDFADSPIPGIPTQRVADATIAADALNGDARSANGPASPATAQGGRSDFVDGRSPDRHSSSHQQLPVTVPDGQVPGSAPSGPGGVDAPGSPAQAPAPQAAAPPASVAPETDQTAPVASSPPASQTADVASVPSKGKGHEKTEPSHGVPAEKPHGKPAETPPGKPAEKPHGKPAPVAPVVPPSVPAPEPPAANGPGKAKGHDK